VCFVCSTISTSAFVKRLVFTKVWECVLCRTSLSVSIQLQCKSVCNSVITYVSAIRNIPYWTNSVITYISAIRSIPYWINGATQLCVHLMCQFCTELADIRSTAMVRQVSFIETSSLISPQKVFCYIT